MLYENMHKWFDRIDTLVTSWMARAELPLLRVSIGIIFCWFGALKLVPGLSPAEDLIRVSLPFLPMQFFLPILAVWEIAIGLGFITGRAMRLTILALLLHMGGTISPLFLRPDRVFTIFPYGLTLEGQYMFKNLVLISAMLVIGATVRGGGLVHERTQLDQTAAGTVGSTTPQAEREVLLR